GIVAVTGTSLAVPLDVLPVLVLLSLSAVGIFSVLFFYAFRAIGAMRTGAVLPSSALWGILLALYVFPTATLSAVQILGAVHLIVGRIFAESDARTLNVGWATLQTALGGPKQASLVPRSLSILEVSKIFAEIAETHGADSTKVRRRLLESLLGRASEDERDV